MLRQVEFRRAHAVHEAADALLRLYRPAQARELLRELAQSGDEAAAKRLAQLEA